MISLARFAHTWKLAERVKVAMGGRINFSKGATSTFCLSYLGCWRCNANGRSQNLSCFYTTKKIPRESMCSIRIYFEIFFEWSCRLYQFATNYISTTTFAVLSLVCAAWTELTSEIFCPNCFLHIGCHQKCFS